jgi:hypothetical protein
MKNLEKEKEQGEIGNKLAISPFHFFRITPRYCGCAVCSFTDSATSWPFASG